MVFTVDIGRLRKGRIMTFFVPESRITGRRVLELTTLAAPQSVRYDAQWGQGFVGSSAFVGLVFQGI